MTKLKRKQLAERLLFFGIWIIVWWFNELGIFKGHVITTILGVIESSLFMTLIAIWSLSAKRRTVQVQMSVILQCVGGLMILWQLIKSVKYYFFSWFVNVEDVKRYLWYLYYLPMLLIVAFLIMMAFLLRKPDDYRLPKKVIIIPLAVSMALFLCVITNDLHQLVFTFPADAAVHTDADYSQNILYYACFAWIGGGALTFFAVALKRCRLPNKKLQWLPISPIAAGLVYTVGYILTKGRWFPFDFTTMLIFTFVALFEVSVWVGLIPSNNHYEELFRASDRSGIITDDNLKVIYASQDTEPMQEDLMRQVIRQGSVTRDGKRIDASRISDGYVFWQDDITKLLEVNEALEVTREELYSYAFLLEEEHKQKKRRQRLIEQQNLYTTIRQKTQHQQGMLTELSQALQETTDTEQARRLLHRITVIGAYVKRRSNLCLLSGKADRIPASEVALCIKESATYLKYAGIPAAVQLTLTGDISGETAGRLYDWFERAVELSMDTAKAIAVQAEQTDDRITLRMMIDCDTDMNVLKDDYPESEPVRDGNTWYCSLTADGGAGS